MLLDRLNNSHLLLLVLLATIIVSTATSVSVLSVVYDRLRDADHGSQQPTIIQQTINRIIERDTEQPVRYEAIPVPEPPQPEVTESEKLGALLTDLETSSFRIYNASSPSGFGVFISPDGALLSSTVLRENRWYTVHTDDESVKFSVHKSDDAYSLLVPIEPYTPKSYLPPFTDEAVPLGTPVLLFGSFEENPRLYSETITEYMVHENDTKMVRTSVFDAVKPVSLIIDGTIAGFLHTDDPWVVLPDYTVLTAEEPESFSDEDTAM